MNNGRDGTLHKVKYEKMQDICTVIASSIELDVMLKTIFDIHSNFKNAIDTTSIVDIVDKMNSIKKFIQNGAKYENHEAVRKFIERYTTDENVVFAYNFVKKNM